MPSPMVVAALSGGVDSATAAALLVAAGHRVVGMTMRLFAARASAAAAAGRCCGSRDIEDARRVCQHLGIPFYVVDFAGEFARDVIGDFTSAYLAGETPNPCVKCNQYIKFTPLLRRARALGAQAVATGHYARLERQSDGSHWLRRGLDPSKDQSYFLFSMPRHELGSVRFPLGGLDKDRVRRLARHYGLPNADKAESQEICFVPDGNYAGFVAARALASGRDAPRPGPIVDQSGRVVGRHRGIHHYTVGQRRGLGTISAAGAAVYVVRVDAGANAVVVGPRAATTQREIAVRDAKWLIDPPRRPRSVLVQVRHRAHPVAAEIAAEGTRARVLLRDGSVVAAPGQAAVFYHGDVVLGGGWIEGTRSLGLRGEAS